MTLNDEQFGTDPNEIYFLNILAILCLVGFIAYTTYTNTVQQPKKGLFDDRPFSARIANRKFGGWDISNQT
jgi:hypothetical protein